MKVKCRVAISNTEQGKKLVGVAVESPKTGKYLEVNDFTRSGYPMHDYLMETSHMYRLLIASANATTNSRIEDDAEWDGLQWHWTTGFYVLDVETEDICEFHKAVYGADFKFRITEPTFK